MTEFCDLKLLANLLQPPDAGDDDNDSISDEDNEQNVDVKTTAKNKVNPYAKIDKVKREDAEVVNFDEVEDTAPSSDWKKTPKWDMSYKQQVTASDVFLQMGPKNPSTASCEDLVLNIDLPGEKLQNIDIKVVEQQLELTSPNFCLTIPLPHPVDPQLGSAKWDSEKEKLIITLRMKREFDCVNL